MLKDKLERLKELYHLQYRVKLELTEQEESKYNELINLYNELVKNKFSLDGYDKELIVTFSFYDNQIRSLRCNIHKYSNTPFTRIDILGVTLSSIGYSFEELKTYNFMNDFNHIILDTIDSFDNKVFLLKKYIEDFNKIIEQKLYQIKNKEVNTYNQIFTIGNENESLLTEVKNIFLNTVEQSFLLDKENLYNFYFKNRKFTIVSGGIDYNDNFYIGFYNDDFNRKLFDIEINFTKNKIKFNVSKNTYILNDKLTVEKFLNKTLRKPLLQLLKEI